MLYQNSEIEIQILPIYCGVTGCLFKVRDFFVWIYVVYFCPFKISKFLLEVTSNCIFRKVSFWRLLCHHTSPCHKINQFTKSHWWFSSLAASLTSPNFEEAIHLPKAYEVTVVVTGDTFSRNSCYGKLSDNDGNLYVRQEIKQVLFPIRGYIMLRRLLLFPYY